MNYDWNFGFLASPDNLRLLADGAWSTLVLSGSALVLGTLLGFALGAFAVGGSSTFSPLRASLSTERKPSLWQGALAGVRLVTLVVIDVLRSIPLLLLILFCYYAFPVLFPFVDRSNVFLPCLFALTINLAAFVAELIRASVIALPKGLLITARAHGLTARQTWLHIVLPQLYRDTLPAMVILYITIVKMSTLASAVSMYEVLHSANAIVQRTYRPIEAYVVVALFFVVLLLPFGILARRLERTSIFRRRSL